MDALGKYQALSGVERLVGSVVFLGVLGLTAALERLQFQLKATEASHWWASNGRDVVNTFAVACLAAGLHFVGFSGPLSLLLAASQVVILTGIQGPLGKLPHANLWSLALSLLLGLPSLLWPAGVDSSVRAFVHLLYA